MHFLQSNIRAENWEKRKGGVFLVPMFLCGAPCFPPWTEWGIFLVVKFGLPRRVEHLGFVFFWSGSFFGKGICFQTTQYICCFFGEKNDSFAFDIWSLQLTLLGNPGIPRRPRPRALQYQFPPP